MLNEFIEKVVVHEVDKSTGDRRQKVDIYFNFIGCFVPPRPEVILTAGEKAKRKRRWRRGTGNGAKQTAYAPGEGGTAGRKGGRESFGSGWLIWVICRAILNSTFAPVRRMAYAHDRDFTRKRPRFGLWH